MFKRDELLQDRTPIVVSFRPRVLEELNEHKTPVPSGELFMVSQMALLGMFMLDANMSAVDHETNRQQAGELRKSFERTGLDPIAFTRRLMEFINQGNDTIAKMTGVPPIEEHFVIQGKVK